MNTLSRRQFLELAESYFAGENLQLACNDQISLEEAYQSMRDAVVDRHGDKTKLSQLRFTSEPQAGDFDLEKLKYK